MHFRSASSVRWGNLGVARKWGEGNEILDFPALTHWAWWYVACEVKGKFEGWGKRDAGVQYRAYVRGKQDAGVKYRAYVWVYVDRDECGVVATVLIRKLFSEFFFFRIWIRIRISAWNPITKVMLYIPKIPIKFGVVSRSFVKIKILFRIRIRIRISAWNPLTKVMQYILKIPTKFGVVSQSFVKIKILFRIRIRIIYFEFQYQTYISYIKHTHIIFFGSTNSFGSYCVHSQSSCTYVGTTRHPYRQTEIFLLVLCSKTYKTWTFIERREFFFHSCDYNTFSFYILRMWWEGKNKKIIIS